MRREPRASEFLTWRACSILLIAIGFCACLVRAPDLGHYFEDENDAQFVVFGQQLHLGKTAGVDLLIPAGFVPAFVSAAAQWVLPGPLGTTVLGAAGYAVCLWLMVAVARGRGVRASRIAVLLVLAFLCIPVLRFFRWQQWLMPLLAIYLGERLILGSARTRLGIGVYGAFLSFDLLYAAHLGIATLAAGIVVVLLAAWFGEGPVSGVRVLRPFIVGFVTPMLLWRLYLIAVGGDLLLNMRITVESLIAAPEGGLVDANGNPISVRLADAPGLVIAAFAAMGICYVLLIIASVYRLRRSGPSALTASGIELVTGVAGLASLPAGIYYPNLNHVLFVISPFFPALALLSVAPFKIMSRFPTLVTGALCALAAFLVFAVRPVWADLSAVTNPVSKLKGMRDPAAILDAHAAGRIAKAVAAASAPEDKVVVVARSMGDNLLLFTGRRSATDFTTVTPALIGRHSLYFKNLEKAKAIMPRVAIVCTDILQKPYMHEWRTLVESNYRQVVYAEDGCEVRLSSRGD